MLRRLEHNLVDINYMADQILFDKQTVCFNSYDEYLEKLQIVIDTLNYTALADLSFFI